MDMDRSLRESRGRIFAVLLTAILTNVVATSLSAHLFMDVAKFLTGIFIFLIPGWVISQRVFENINHHFILTTPVSVGIAYLSFILLSLLPVVSPVNTIAIMCVNTLITVALYKPTQSSDFSNVEFSKYGVVFALLLVSTITVSFMSRTGPRNLFYALIIVLIAITSTHALITSRRKLSPLSILFVSTALIYINTLSSGYVQGRDIHKEYYYASLVTTSGSWDHTISHAFNSLLSIAGLPPILTVLSGQGLTFQYRAVLPILLALIPVIVYVYVSDVFENWKMALFCSLCFMFLFPFYIDLTAIPRQYIGMMFVASLVYVGFSERKNKPILLLLIFSLLVSHYATSILFISIFLGYMSVTEVISRLSRSGLSKYRLFTWAQLLIGLVLFTAWFAYTSQSVFIRDLSLLLINFITELSQTLLNPGSSQSSSSVSGGSLSAYHTLNKILYFILVGLLGIGLVYQWYQLLFDKIDNLGYHHTCLSTVVLGFMGIMIVGPYFYIETSRLLQMCMIILAPLAYLAIHPLESLDLNGYDLNLTHASLSIFLAVILILSSGLVYEAMNTYPTSPGLSQQSIEDGTLEEKYEFYNHYTTHGTDVTAAKWSQEYVEERTLYSTGISYYAFVGYGMLGPEATTYLRDTPISKQLTENTTIQKDSYIFVSYLNTHHNMYVEKRAESALNIKKYNRIENKTQNSKKVYTAGGSEIYINE